MQTRNRFSVNQIVILLVFLCAALMTSVFVFHMRNKQTGPIISAEVGLIYPAAREIKPFELVAADQTKFTQENFLGHWTMLFFGFTHCSKVCPTTLALMSKVYQQLKPQYPNLQVVLISLDPERDTLSALANYTHAYHPDFIGATGKLPELRKLQSQLGIYSARDGGSGPNYQLQHTSSILLIAPNGKWAGIFRYGLTPTQLKDAFTTSVRALS